MSLRSEPQPDFAILKAKLGGYSEHPRPSDVLLLIEVGDSTPRYELRERASLYASHGIPEYWVIDLRGERVWRHRDPSGSAYALVDEIVSGSLPLPVSSAAISVDEIF